MKPTLIGGQIHVDTFGVELIASFENVYEAWYCPFWDPYGKVWTRGFGETDWSGDFGGVCISHAQALSNVAVLVELDYQYAVKDLDVNLSHRQVDALDDFVWNVGPGDLCCSIAANLRARDFRAAGYDLLAYSYAGGVFLEGLYRRRLREDALLQEGEPPPVSRGQLEAELAAHRRELRRLEVQQRDIRGQLSRWGCRRLESEHRRTGPRCKGAEAAGQRVDAHGRLELRFIHQLERELS